MNQMMRKPAKMNEKDAKKGDMSARSVAILTAFNQAILNVLRSITSQSISEAFPYANPEVVNTLVEQTKTVFTHYATDRWESLGEERSILELCDLFDRLEASARKDLEAGLAPHRLTRDPQLSIPPLILQLINPLLSHYGSLIEDQRRRNGTLHDNILKQANEADRLEKEICEKMDDVRSSIERLEKVIE